VDKPHGKSRCIEHMEIKYTPQQTANTHYVLIIEKSIPSINVI